MISSPVLFRLVFIKNNIFGAIIFFTFRLYIFREMAMLNIQGQVGKKIYLRRLKYHEFVVNNFVDKYYKVSKNLYGFNYPFSSPLGMHMTLHGKIKFCR